MFATCNLPGSSSFTYVRGTKKECQAWLDCLRANEPYHVWQGGHLVTEKEARSWKWQDGNPIFSFEPGPHDYTYVREQQVAEEASWEQEY